MIVIFQIGVIFLVGLIAYWWANQGFFSSLLHFVAVVCAGALALAFWEPLVMGVLLKNWASDNYAWGLSLGVLFLVALVLIRVAFDRLAPANVQIPHAANLILGGIFGLGSGVLTVGILMIAIGFTQAADELIGFKGVGREGNTISTTHGGDSHKLWAPVHTWTAEFFEFMSARAFFPEIGRQPLSEMYPDLDRVSWGMHRDTFRQGTSRTSLPPESIRITKVTLTDQRVLVDVTANTMAYDHAQMFVLSRSQARLLAYAPGGDVSVGYADRWSQEVATGTTAPSLSRTFLFDNPSHYVTSKPGSQDVAFQLEFPFGGSDDQLTPGSVPRYLQIKGVRYELPRILTGSAVEDRGAPQIDTNIPPDDPSAPMAQGEIEIRADIRPITNATINNLLSISHVERYLTEGDQTFRKGERAGNRDTQITNIYYTEGTKIVRVNVSRNTGGNLHGSARERAEKAALADPTLEDGPRLVDSGREIYRPKGFIVEKLDDTRICLRPSNLIRSVSELEYLPTDGTNKMWLIFEVPIGTTLTSFRYGNSETAMRANLTVPP